MGRILKSFFGASVLALLLAIAGFWSLAVLLRPAPAEWAQGSASPRAFSIMTFNISLGGKPGWAALDALAAADPDIVCIQEMTRDLARAFEARYSEIYPHRLLRPGSSVHGIGIASKIPLQDEVVIREGMFHLPALGVTVAPGGDRLRIVCVHLIPPHARPRDGEPFWDRYKRNEGIRTTQAQIVLDSLDGMDVPAIILGDMNEWTGQAALSRFAEAGFADACEFQPNRCGASWPGAAIPGWPALFRIDHILGRGLRFADAAVLDAGGSDHFPAAARIIPR